MSQAEEKKVERHLVNCIKLIGGEAYKFTSPARRFVPDRVCVMPQGILIFVEVKGSNGRLSSGQVRELDRLHAKGHACFVVESKEDVNTLVNKLNAAINKRKSKEDPAHDATTH